MTVNYESKKRQKIKVGLLSLDLPGDIEGKYLITSVSRLRFEQGTSQIQLRSVFAGTNCVGKKVCMRAIYKLLLLSTKGRYLYSSLIQYLQQNTINGYRKYCEFSLHSSCGSVYYSVYSRPIPVYIYFRHFYSACIYCPKPSRRAS